MSSRLDAALEVPVFVCYFMFRLKLWLRYCLMCDVCFLVVLFRYWGWGREDDEFYVRLKEAKLNIRRPSEDEIKTGYNTFRHIHDKIRRPRDNKRYGDQKVSGSVRDRRTGADTVKYNITEIYDVTVKGAPVTVYNVQLDCDRSDTPWCEVPTR